MEKTEIAKQPIEELLLSSIAHPGDFGIDEALKKASWFWVTLQTTMKMIHGLTGTPMAKRLDDKSVIRSYVSSVSLLRDIKRPDNQYVDLALILGVVTVEHEGRRCNGLCVMTFEHGTRTPLSHVPLYAALLPAEHDEFTLTTIVTANRVSSMRIALSEVQYDGEIKVNDAKESSDVEVESSLCLIVADGSHSEICSIVSNDNVVYHDDDSISADTFVVKTNYAASP